MTQLIDKDAAIAAICLGLPLDLMSVDQIRILERVTALPAAPMGVKVKPYVAQHVKAMLDGDPQSTMFGVPAKVLRDILAALTQSPAPTLGDAAIKVLQHIEAKFAEEQGVKPDFLSDAAIVNELRALAALQTKGGAE